MHSDVGKATVLAGAAPRAALQRVHRPTRQMEASLLCSAAIFVGSLILTFVVNRAIVRLIPATGDEPWYLMQTYTLIHYHSVDLAPVVKNATLYHQFLNGSDTHTQDYLGSGERMLPNLPGYAVLIAPFYLLRGRLGIVAFQALLAALTATLLFDEATRLFRSRLAGLFAALAYLFALPALLYVSQIFPSESASFVAFSGYIVAVRVLPAVRGWWLVAASCVLGILVFVLPWLHAKYALAAVALVALAAVGLRARLRWPIRSMSGAERLAWASIASVAGALLISFLLIGLYSHQYYGSWLPRISRFADSGPSLRQFDLGRGLTLYQDILLSRSSGLLPWVPLDLLALPGLVLLWWRSRRNGLNVTLMPVALLGIFVSACFSPQVYQGLAFPSRFSVECAPFFALGVTCVFAGGMRVLRKAVASRPPDGQTRVRSHYPDGAPAAAMPNPEALPEKLSMLPKEVSKELSSSSIVRRGATVMTSVTAGLVVLTCVFLLSVSGYFTAQGTRDPILLYGSLAGSRMPMKYPDQLPAWWFNALPETPGTLAYYQTLPLAVPATSVTQVTARATTISTTTKAPVHWVQWMYASYTNLPPGSYRATYTFSCSQPHSLPLGASAIQIVVNRLSEMPKTSILVRRPLVERNEPLSVCSGVHTAVVTLMFTSNGYDPIEFGVGIAGSGSGATGTIQTSRTTRTMYTITGTVSCTPIKNVPHS